MSNGEDKDKSLLELITAPHPLKSALPSWMREPPKPWEWFGGGGGEPQPTGLPSYSYQRGAPSPTPTMTGEQLRAADLEQVASQALYKFVASRGGLPEPVVGGRLATGFDVTTMQVTFADGSTMSPLQYFQAIGLSEGDIREIAAYDVYGAADGEGFSPEQYEQWLAQQQAVSEADIGLTQAETAYRNAETALSQQELQLNQINQELYRLNMEREWAIDQGDLALRQQTEARIASIQQQQVNLETRVQQGRYQLDIASLDLDRQMAQYQAQYGQQELAQRQYEFAQELQQSPIDWIQGWQATRGMPFEVGGQGFQMPEITQPQFTLPEFPPWAGGAGAPNTPPWAGVPGVPPTGGYPTGGMPPTYPTTGGMTSSWVDELGRGLTDAYRAQYEGLLGRLEGTPLEGMYGPWGSPTMGPAGQPPIDVAVAQYYGHMTPGGGGFAPRVIGGAPQIGVQPGDVQGQALGEAMMGEYWSPASQRGMGEYMLLPGPRTVTSTPYGPQTTGMMPTAEYVGLLNAPAWAQHLQGRGPVGAGGISAGEAAGFGNVLGGPLGW